eukprot:c16080_g1_i1.p1 GENE.c16080_g1_i1~~c16080_g1_i1.p1  ORF type:complete len:269 (-),score=116.29 c16080_g1_i1:36-842(-)
MFGQRISSGAVALGVGGYLLSNVMYTVYPGQRVIIFDRIKGLRDEVIGEGTHFLIPFIQTPKYFDIRLKPRTITSVTGTKDLQDVNISLRVLSYPQEQRLSDIMNTYGVHYDESVLPSIGNEVLKSVVAQYDAAQLITKRDVVSKMVRDALTKRAKDFGIILQDVSITHLAFGAEFTKAIESKQVMSQEAERSKYVVQKMEELKKAAIIRAEGDAEYARMMQEATKANPSFVELRQVEATKEIISKLAKSPNVTFLPNQTNVLLGLPK